MQSSQDLLLQADEHLKACRCPELISIYETLEFQVSTIDIDLVRMNTIYEPLLASYLVVYDLYSAKSLVSRIPKDVIEGSPQLQVLTTVYQLLWSLARQSQSPKPVYELLHQSRWDSNIAPLIAALHDSIQERELNLLAKAYTSLTVPMAASRVFLNESNVAEQLVATRGWRFDAAAGILYTKEPELAANRSIGLQELGQLSDIAAHLEEIRTEA